SLAGAAKAGDHLVENQQDAMLVADLAQALQVSLWWNENAGRSGDRLDETGSDRARAIHVDEALQIFRQLDAGCRFATAKPVFRQQGRTQMHDAGHDGTEGLAVAHHAAKRDTADIDAVIGALAADEARALALAIGDMIGERDLDGAFHRFRAGIAE